MAESANVNSIDALKDFRSAWVRFAEEARNALTDVDFDLRRTVDWLTHDQRLYWQAEIKRANEMLGRAKTELHRKKLGGMGEHKPDTVVEEKHVRQAKDRLELSEDKLEAVRAWIPELQHAVQEYHTQAQPLGDMLEGDLKKALMKLDRMIDALEAYLAVAAPSTPTLGATVGLTRDYSPAPTTAAATSTASSGANPPAPATTTAAPGEESPLADEVEAGAAAPTEETNG